MSIIFLSKLEGNTKRWLISIVLAIAAIRLFMEQITPTSGRILSIPTPYILGALLVWCIILIVPIFKPKNML